MVNAIERFDLIVLGAGIFGCHAALHFSRERMRVLLIERERRPWTKASMVNQARVHSGYHYPRSIKTARIAHGHRERFIRENGFAINSWFTQYYGIDRHGSLTSADQFSRFCQKINIPLRESTRRDLFNHDRLQALFEAEEVSFDPFLLRAHYLAEIKESSVEALYGWQPTSVELDGDEWRIELHDCAGTSRSISAGGALNATYANINELNRMFSADEIPVTHELSEILLLHSPPLVGTGLTVMDGPYVSIMPFGLSGLHSLSSVLYTHKAFSGSGDPVFQCQTRRPDCRPAAIRNCTDCSARPATNTRKMINQLQHYLARHTDIYVHGSLYTVKTKLKSAFIDDGRPTDICVYRKAPFFGCIFSGKINSIYEVERLSIHA